MHLLQSYRLHSLGCNLCSLGAISIICVHFKVFKCSLVRSRCLQFYWTCVSMCESICNVCEIHGKIELYSYNYDLCWQYVIMTSFKSGWTECWKLFSDRHLPISLCPSQGHYQKCHYKCWKSHSYIYHKNSSVNMLVISPLSGCE